MKKTKHNLSAFTLGVTLAMGTLSGPASALQASNLPANPAAAGAKLFFDAEINPLSKNPSFDTSERTGLALVESSLSLIAARTHIDPVSCASKVYKLKVDATGGTEGTAVITGDGDKAVLNAVLTEATLGAQVDVTADPGSVLYGAKIKNYKGDHQWSRKNNIFLDHASWDFKHPQSGRIIPYDEHSIKDYYKRILVAGLPVVDPDPGADNESWEFDHGFEVITKKNKPVAKWGELSWYKQQDGGDGILKVKKKLVQTNSCEIIYEATGFFPFEFEGKVTVKPAPKKAVCNLGDPTLAYNAMPFGVENCNNPSLGFEAQNTNEFGDRVQLAGTARGLVSLRVLFSSFGCSDSGHWNTGTTAPCVTTPGATFTHPITANIYSPGDLVNPIATVTQPVTFPYRPSADPVNCPMAGPGGSTAGSMWFNPLADPQPTFGQCQNAIHVLRTFNFPAAITLPDEVIWTVAYNTSTSGYDPITPPPAPCNANGNNPGCGYDSLNVGAKSHINAPYAGIDVLVDEAFRSFGGPAAPLVSELGWADNRPEGAIITQ